MTLRRSLTCVFLVHLVSISAFASNKTKSRLEELFVWRVSDTLELSPDVESKFSSEFKRLSEKKTQLAQDIDGLVHELSAAKDPKKVESLLKTYREKVTDQSRISVEEVESLEKLFGKPKFAQYLVLKRDLTQKLKDFVSSPSKGESGSPNKLHTPKIIQDESN
jgi:hypothetical protein